MNATAAPPETLEALRRIDPAADLVHVEGATWILGTRGDNPGAREKLEAQLKLVDPHKATSWEAGLEFELLQLFARGFRPVAMYKLGEETDSGDVITFGWIVSDFELRDFNWRVRPKESEAEFRKAISFDEGNKRRAQVFAEFADQEGGSIFRHVMKRARSFVQRVKIPGG